MPEIIDCHEFDEISIRVGSLLDAGELRLDERITNRGYLSAAIRNGQIVLNATRFVGTIPLTPELAIRVKPRASIANLSYMLVRSSIIPAVISGYSRGYLPRFTAAENAERIYGRSLVDGAAKISKRGFLKEYLQPRHSPPWRGRLLASETVKKHASRGVRFRHEFQYRTLSQNTIENIALKEALLQTKLWFLANDNRSPIPGQIKEILKDLHSVETWRGSRNELVSMLGHRIRTLSPHHTFYRDPLWSALIILQSALPEVSEDGFVRLESMIIDVSKVFEAYVRRELKERLEPLGYTIENGDDVRLPFFADSAEFRVKPDIVIRHDGRAVAILDAKYKPSPKETDRYEVLSFMDALGVSIGGFVCPSVDTDASRFMGTTLGGKSLSCIRYDLAAADVIAEADRFSGNVIRMINSDHNFV